MLSENVETVIISTGNILNVNPAATLRKSNEELLDSLKLCTECKEETEVKYQGVEAQVLRANQEIQDIIKKYARNEISIVTKLFLNKSTKLAIKEAVVALLGILNVDCVDNLVLAYHPFETASKVLPETPDVASAVSYMGDMKWSKRNEKSVQELRDLWSSLEHFASIKQICQLGIADLDVEALKELHSKAIVPPTINQINLANCCAVPPELNEFCTQHDIQLLTHSDPEILISDGNFVIPNYSVDWSLRYHIHIRCRGVLTAKGYIIKASKVPQNPLTTKE